MTDINEQIRPAPSKTILADGPNGMDSQDRQSADPALLDLAELLFFAYRDFTSEPDKILDEYGFGRAHHRVLHFVNRHPGLRVADLLEILKITKQSLGRVLKQLVDEDFIAQEAGKTDRRERRLFTTARGQELADRLAAPQLERLAAALDACGKDGYGSIAAFLRQMISEGERERVDQLVSNRRPARTVRRGGK